MEDGKVRLESRPRGNWLLVGFHMAWLGGWTVGGMWVIGAFLRDPHPFIGFWLCGWAVGWAYVAGMLGWWLAGRERIVADPSGVGVETRKPWGTRRAFYDALGVSHIELDRSLPMPSAFTGKSSTPWSFPGRVRFDHGGRTHGTGIDPAQGRALIERLRTVLPPSCFAD